MSDGKPPSLSNALSRLLREAQANQHLTATALAQHIGCHRVHLYRWLRGECQPHKEEHLEGIARLCGLSVEALHRLIFPADSQPGQTQFQKHLRYVLQHLKSPQDLPPALSLLAEEAFHADQASLFLAGINDPLPCMWCAGRHPPAPDRRRQGNPFTRHPPNQVSPIIHLYRYVLDWSGFTPQSQEDLIVRAFATQKVQEFLDASFLQSLGIASSWFLVAPLVHEGRSLGCLVFRAAERTYLNPEEGALLGDVCRYLTASLLASQTAFEAQSLDQILSPIVDLYTRKGFFRPPQEEGKSQTAPLPEVRLSDESGP